MDERGLRQRRDALAKGNEVRYYRRDLKREMARGEKTLTDVLAERDWRVETMRVYDLLVATPAIGKVKARGWLQQVRLDRNSRVCGTTMRQRMLLSLLDQQHRARLRSYRQLAERHREQVAA